MPDVFVGPDLGPNCWQKLSVNNTGRERIKGRHSAHSFPLNYPSFLIQRDKMLVHFHFSSNALESKGCMWYTQENSEQCEH